ncbi:DoxX family protein [Lacipirellula limnantheis]|uniref:Inner membrane protein YphA n=1 Tax=Lacipirellula limnantheis TaxID=2528024 RepID=A0A517U653_9BACT|nr:DoxX family protein [Lacipirellula limnantheis]QDT76083.1 Inner membrane protein YphA [Lacipirellula limnantheis]
MSNPLIGLTSVAGRVLLVGIFFMSAVGNKIPNFSQIAGYMASEGVPAPTVMLTGAIAFLIVGSVLIAVGYQARVGAALLLVFLVAATYFFHDFWTFDDPAERQQQTIQFMKNASLVGAMLFIMANGAGAWSLDNRRSAAETTTA